MTGATAVRYLALIAAAIAGLQTHALTGERTNVAGLGMGRTGAAVSHGLDAVGVNPANLESRDGALVTISLLPLGFNVGSDFLTYDLYTAYFTGVSTDSGRVGRYLSDPDKQRLLHSFPGSSGNGTLDAELRGFGMSLALSGMGTVAVTVTDRMSGRGTLSRAYAEFLLVGNPPGSSYDFGETGGKAAWTREFALSFATPIPGLLPIPHLSAGLSLKFVQGFSYYAAERYHARLTTSADGFLTGDVDTWIRSAGLDPSVAGFPLFPDPAGQGVGFDIGVAGDLSDVARVGLSVTDVGSIHWSANVKERIASGSFALDDPLDPSRRDSVQELLRGETRNGVPFNTALPATVRLGTVLALHRLEAVRRILSGELLLALDYTQGLADAPGITRIPRCSLGVEYSPWSFLPLRAGISLWGAEGTGVAAGIGYRSGIVDLDCAVESIDWIVAPATFSRGAVAVGMKLKF